MTVRQNLGLGSWPRRRALLTPERVAFECEGGSVTYGEFSARVEHLSAWMAHRGVVPGDRIAYWGVNHLALLETLFASTRIGAVCVLVNARLAPGEAEFILRDSTPAALFFGREQAESVAVIAKGIPPRVLVDVDATGFGISYGSVMDDDADPVPEVASGLDDPALIMYTSGTTGRPKGAVLSHGNIFFNDVNVLIEDDVRPNEVCLAAAPLFHIAGLNGLVLPTFLKGGTVIIQRTVDPVKMFAAFEERSVTSMFTVPTMLDALAQHRLFADADLSRLRTIIVGGAPVPERILRVWADRGIAVKQGYGLTETAPAVLKLSDEDGIRKAGSAGKPQFLVDVRLVTPGGTLAAPGEVGEIQTVGPNVIREYWQRPDATADAFDSGWFRTGDAAVQDEDGYFWIRDRYKDMYVSGGENVYPAEVESALLNVPGVSEAAVVGVPDAVWGEAGKAFVVLEPEVRLTPDELRAAVSPFLSRFKIPKQIEFIEQMPRTSTGKLLKTDLRSREGAAS
jgi:acyl-CoA synthetase (AMP-forming)/AMP-acid ligase II